MAGNDRRERAEGMEGGGRRHLVGSLRGGETLQRCLGGDEPPRVALPFVPSVAVKFQLSRIISLSVGFSPD